MILISVKRDPKSAMGVSIKFRSTEGFPMFIFLQNLNPVEIQILLSLQSGIGLV